MGTLECYKCKKECYFKDTVRTKDCKETFGGPCDYCHEIFCEECSGVSSTEIRALINKKRIVMHYCEECRVAVKNALHDVPVIQQQLKEVISELKSLKEQMNEQTNLPASPSVPTYAQVVSETTHLKNQVQQLEEKFQQQTVSQTKLELEPAIQEMQERERRAQNLLIFGVEESNLPDPEQKLAFDLDKATSIIRKINGLTEPAKVKITRIGRYEANKKRPIRATFPTKEEALQVLRLKSKLEQGETYIKYDLTPNQRTYLKTVISELETRKAGGETDLTIKYQNNTPKIVRAAARAASKN